MTSKKPQGFLLPSSITIRNVQEVAALLQDAHTVKSVALNAEAVEEITSPGLQLLAAHWQYAKHQEHNFHITNPSAPLKEALSCAGLSYLLD